MRLATPRHMWKGDACPTVEAPGSVVVDGSPDPQLEPKVETDDLGGTHRNVLRCCWPLMLLLLAAMSLCSKGWVSLQSGKVLGDDDHLQVRMAVAIFILN